MRWRLGRKSERKAFKFIASALLSLITLAGGEGAARAMEEGDASSANSILIHRGDPLATQPGGPADRLMQAAISQGHIRVIIGLNFVMKAEHALTPQQAETQARELQGVQSRIADRVLGSASAQADDRLSFIPYMSMFVTPNQLRLLLADPDVATIQEDVPSQPSLAQSTKLVNADDLWAKGVTGSGRVVAVLDTGVSRTHPMFAGKIASEACYSTTNAAAKLASLCPGGVTSSVASGSGNNCPTTLAGCDHGTHVAGIAVGSASALYGMGRGGRVIAMQIFTKNTATNKISSYQSDQLKALQRVYALRNLYQIAAVNMSLQGGRFSGPCDASYSAIAAAVAMLRSSGIATVASSGNQGYPTEIAYPSCLSGVIAVGNSTKSDLLAVTSNHSPQIKLLAPGSAITSAVPGNAYGVKSGTSMASPHVAGALAQLRQAKPTATIDDMVGALVCSGKMIDKRAAAGTPAITPASPRIEMLGAYNFLLKPPNVSRTWNFSLATDKDEWTILRSNWVVGGGRFYVNRPAATWSVAQVPSCSTKLQVTSRLQRIDNYAGNYHHNSGIFFKVETDFPSRRFSGYWAAYNNCPATNSGSCSSNTALPRGIAVLWRVSGLEPVTGAGSGSLLCQKAIRIANGGYNTIRVVSNGSRHSYYLNNQLVCTVTDSTYTAGNVLIGGAFPGDGSAQFLGYDSVAIQAIGTGAIEPPIASADAELINPAARPYPESSPLKNMVGMTSASRDEGGPQSLLVLD